jgi:periplasmic divalent cation tolerance protein
MTDVLLVLCTFPDSEQARQIGTLLVERQLAACMNLIPSVESIYQWQGRVESASETLAIFKTSAREYPALRDELTEMHPYEVPEIIAMSPENVAEPYRQWVLSSVGLADR